MIEDAACYRRPAAKHIHHFVQEVWTLSAMTRSALTSCTQASASAAGPLPQGMGLAMDLLLATEVKGKEVSPIKVGTGVIHIIVVATELEIMITLAKVIPMVKDNTRPGDATTAVLFNIVIGLSIIVKEETDVLQAKLRQGRSIVVLVRSPQ